jgi:hypothetical protein
VLIIFAWDKEPGKGLSQNKGFRLVLNELRFVKVSFPVTCLMPYYAKTGRSRPLIV